jgi:tRNA(fMet)-specific endonuclease VapC
VFVLDTDHLTLLEHGQSAEADRLRARLNGLDEADVAVTIVSFEEQTRGWLAYLARARTLTRQIEAYARLRRLVENYRVIPLLDFDATAAAEFQRLSRSRLRMGTMDLKIAAITLIHEATLVSRNLSGFPRVPGLKVEGWTI